MDECSNCGSPMTVFFVPAEVTFFVPDGEDDGMGDVCDFPRVGIVLGAEHLVELWDKLGAVVRDAAEKGQV